MLERELWKKLPMAQGTMPDLASALGGNSQNGLLAKTGSSSSLSASATTASQNGTGATTSDGFDAYLVQGNPWRATQGQPAVQCRACSPLLSSPLLSSPLLSSPLLSSPLQPLDITLCKAQCAVPITSLLCCSAGFCLLARLLTVNFSKLFLV